MNYELVKNDFIKLKKEELAYIDSTSKISSNKILSEYEKLEIYRTLKNYQVKINKMYKKLFDEVIKDKQLTRNDLKDVIIEFDIDKHYLSSVIFHYDWQKKNTLEDLGIDVETFKFKLTIKNIIPNAEKYKGIDPDIIQNNQKLIENPIYVFIGYYDYSEDCYGPLIGEVDDYLYGVYTNICNSVYSNDKMEVPKRNRDDFEKDKIIIHLKRYVSFCEVKQIFEEELLNSQNKTLNDCINQTKNKVEELNYMRTPEYKEKILFERISELYKNIKGELLQEEILYSGNFLDIIKETYKLSNKTIVQKEKVVKNDGRDSVIVIALTQDKEYIITFQNRIKDKIIAEFPSGYIENNEDAIEAAKRELKEETGYTSDDLFIVDEAYTSPGIDNSTTYIVIANNCIKIGEKNVNSSELINYGLFSEIELNYLINKNIMNGAMNKLAYYNLVNNVDDCNFTYLKNNQKIKIYKKLRKKMNPLCN